MTLTESIKSTYAVMGQELGDLTLEILVEDLALYPLQNVRTALSRCRKELKRLTLADILDRLPGGHPGAEEAWAMVSRGMHNEALTMIWTDEMREAYGVAHGVFEDEVAARMAFKEAYQRAVALARNDGQAPNWSVSQGTDKADRERAIMEGVKQGRLSATYAQRLLPHPEEPQTLALLQTLCPRLLS